MKPNGNCILKPLCFFRQFVLVKFENCFLKLAFPLWVFQFSVSHRSSSDQTSVGKRAKHALGSGFGRGVTGAGTWMIRGGQLAPVKARGRPRHTMLWSNYRWYVYGKTVSNETPSMPFRCFDQGSIPFNGNLLSRCSVKDEVFGWPRFHEFPNTRFGTIERPNAGAAMGPFSVNSENVEWWKHLFQTGSDHKPRTCCICIQQVRRERQQGVKTVRFSLPNKALSHRSFRQMVSTSQEGRQLSAD